VVNLALVIGHLASAGTTSGDPDSFRATFARTMRGDGGLKKRPQRGDELRPWGPVSVNVPKGVSARPNK
jgi:hypothetical protein